MASSAGAGPGLCPGSHRRTATISAERLDEVLHPSRQHASGRICSGCSTGRLGRATASAALVGLHRLARRCPSREDGWRMGISGCSLAFAAVLLSRLAKSVLRRFGRRVPLGAAMRRRADDGGARLTALSPMLFISARIVAWSGGEVDGTSPLMAAPELCRCMNMFQIDGAVAVLVPCAFDSSIGARGADGRGGAAGSGRLNSRAPAWRRGVAPGRALAAKPCPVSPQIPIAAVPAPERQFRRRRP